MIALTARSRLGDSRAMSSRAIVLLCCLFGTLAAAGCRTPQGLCDEYFDERNAFEAACGLPESDRNTFCRRDDETTCGCGAVATVENPDEIVMDCFGFMRRQSETCDSPRLFEYPENMPAACDPTTHFFYLE